jgi:hypothetical protein
MKQKRGFACLTPERRAEIARAGGKAPRKSPRGFAAMSASERRKIAAMGGASWHGPKTKTQDCRKAWNQGYEKGLERAAEIAYTRYLATSDDRVAQGAWNAEADIRKTLGALKGKGGA